MSIWDALRKKRKILIVDDDRDFAASLAAVISSYKNAKLYDTDISYDATGALKIVKQNPPELIILDINLPDINGFRLCRTLRDEIGYQGKILMLTVRSEIDDIKRGEGAGADGYIQKPVSNDSLLQALDELFARKN